MASLVSPGVSVTITDESFFIPASAPTVPLIFIATADDKVQPDENASPALGTQESNVVRTITSLTQSVETYGVPTFLEDAVSGAQHHGDARNEYGVFALNQYLGIGNRAYVVRADVNLNDDLDTIRTSWDTEVLLAQTVLEGLINDYLASQNIIAANGGIQEVTTIATVADTDIDPLEGRYFNIDAPEGGYYVWYNNGRSGGSPDFGDDPINPNRTGIKVVFTNNDTAATIASLTQAAINAITNFTATVSANVVTVTNVRGGAVTEAGDVVAGSPDLPTGFTFTVIVDGTTEVEISTVDNTVLKSLARTAMEDAFDKYSFRNTSADFFTATNLSPLLIYPNGYDAPPVPAAPAGYMGFDYRADTGWLSTGSPVGEYTANTGGLLLIDQADDFKYTLEFFNLTKLGDNDTTRRAAIVTALQAAIVSNTEIRSENFDYNLILCPGYPETVDEMVSLAVDINEEALVIADTPMNLDADGITNPGTGWAGTTARQRSVHIAYYYPSALASNLDGKNVACSAAGVALRTMAYNDDVAFLWFAPAGLRRGIISGITSLGYVTGDLGGPTTWVELNLNQGQRDALYTGDGAAGDMNPLVFFPGQGFVVWGQKTSAPAASAMDRVNVSRLIKYVKRSLRRNTLSFVFQPNDQLTRDNLKAAVDGFLGDLITKRGLYDFATISDESNNTPFRIDNNEMYIDVALKPVKAAEFIYIPIRIVTSGAEI